MSDVDVNDDRVDKIQGEIQRWAFEHPHATRVVIREEDARMLTEYMAHRDPGFNHCTGGPGKRLYVHGLLVCTPDYPEGVDPWFFARHARTS